MGKLSVLDIWDTQGSHLCYTTCITVTHYRPDIIFKSVFAYRDLHTCTIQFQMQIVIRFLSLQTTSVYMYVYVGNYSNWFDYILIQVAYGTSRIFFFLSGALAMEALHRQVLPFLLRRMKEDVLQDLPPKIIQDYHCDPSPLQVSAVINIVYIT